MYLNKKMEPGFLKMEQVENSTTTRITADAVSLISIKL